MKLTNLASAMIFARFYLEIGFVTMRVLARLLKDHLGVTAVEYTLIAALIAVAAIASYILIGSHLSTTFSTIAGKL